MICGDEHTRTFSGSVKSQCPASNENGRLAEWMQAEPYFKVS